MPKKGYDGAELIHLSTDENKCQDLGSTENKIWYDLVRLKLASWEVAPFSRKNFDV